MERRPIRADEPLYRRISARDVFGTQVMPSAVDLPGCSFNRHDYCDSPEDVFVRAEPENNGVASMTAGDLPASIPRSRPELEPYVFAVADVPLGDNDAHCEVRMHKQGKLYSKNLTFKTNAEKEIEGIAKDALARKMRVLIEPSPIEPLNQ